MKVSAPELPPDPGLAAQQQQAQADQLAAFQTKAEGDTAQLMARYGTLVAYGAAPAAPPPTSTMIGGSNG